MFWYQCIAKECCLRHQFSYTLDTYFNPFCVIFLLLLPTSVQAAYSPFQEEKEKVTLL